MSSIFEKNIHPNIQKELHARSSVLSGRKTFSRGTIADDGGYDADYTLDFNEMMSRTTYAILVTDYDKNSGLINKGLSSGEIFEEGNNLRQTKFGFIEGRLGSYRNTEGGSDTGIRPICGIKSVELEFLNPNGVRKAVISWNAPSLEAVNEYSDFLRPGTRVALQFGWSYRSNRFEYETFISFDQNNQKIKVDRDIYKDPYTKIIKAHGNMDALGGSVINYSSKLRDDGGFDCTTEVIGFGISYMQDTNSGKADSTFKVARQVRAALQSLNSNAENEDVLKSATNFLTNLGISREVGKGEYGNLEPRKFVEAIAYNDMDHAILNLDKICLEILDVSIQNKIEEIQDNTELSDGRTINEYIDDSLERGELDADAEEKIKEIEETQQQEIETRTSDTKFTTTGGQIDSLESTQYGMRVDPNKNMFAVYSNTKVSENVYDDSMGGKDISKVTSNDISDVYVRWGWFEDNILTKYGALVNDSGETLNEFRSITGKGTNNVTGNLISYNQFMIPADFKDVFYASSKNNFDDNTLQRDGRNKTGIFLKLLENLNKNLLPQREFENSVEGQARLRNMFINVSTIQQSYLGISNSEINQYDSENFLYRKPTVSSVQKGTQKIMIVMSNALYGVPNLIIENNEYGAGIVDKNLAGIKSNKVYSESLTNPTSFQGDVSQDKYDGMFLFPTYEKGSIVKNQNFELNIPNKLQSVAFLNSGGSLLTRKTNDSEENKFAILAENFGYAANSYLPAPFEARRWGVLAGIENGDFKNTNKNSFNFYGGLVSEDEWRKIPLVSRGVPESESNLSGGEVAGPPALVKGKFYTQEGKVFVAEEVTKMIVREERTKFSGDIDDVTTGQVIKRKVPIQVLELVPQKQSNTYNIDNNPSISWLEAISLKPQALTFFRKLFLNENEATTVPLDVEHSWADLSIDIDGIGGLRPRNMFNCSYMPQVYNRQIIVKDGTNTINYGPSFYFQIKTLTQKIDDSGWTTSIDSLMARNHEAYKHLQSSDLYKTSNAISSIGRNFERSRQKSLTERLNSILEPISVAKTKFDTYMRESQDYVELQELAGTGSATPYSDSYEKWRKKREVRQRNKNAKEELELAGKMSNYINNLDIEPIGRDYILSSQAKAGPYTDVDYGLELVQQVQGNAKAPKDIRKVEFKPIQEEFPLTPVTVGSDASNFVFETNAYRRVMSEDNVDTELNTTTIPPGFVNSRGLPKGELVETDAQTERGLAESGLVAAGAALTAEQLESSGLPPEAYITQEQIQIITGVPSDAAPENKPVDEETAEVVDQSEGKNIFSQILGLFNKKTKEEVEVKNSPPPSSSELKKDTKQRVDTLLKELGLGSAKELYTEIEFPKITEDNIEDKGDIRERGSIIKKRRYRVFGFSGKVKGVKFNDGNGVKIEELPITSVNEIRVETGASGANLLTRIQGTVNPVFELEAQEYTLKKYKETIS